MSERFLILGATGLVGRHVVQMLEEEGRNVVRATRSPTSSRDMYFDLLEPDSFSRALDGASIAMLISRPGDEDAHVHAGPFIDAMRRSGIRRVVVLSALGSERRLPPGSCSPRRRVPA